MENRISGVILAGGANTRFGGMSKANIVIGGETIISRIISTTSHFFSEIIIVTDKEEEFRKINQCRIIEDQYTGVGPLGGIHAALKASSEDAIFVFAGDMPFLDAKIIQDQINEFFSGKHDVLIPMVGQCIEPLHAIYRKSVLKDLETFIIEGKSRAVRDFLNETKVGYVQLPETTKTKLAFTNINSPLDIGKFVF